MWVDFFPPVLAFGVSLLALTGGAATFHRVRVWRSRNALVDNVVVRLERRAPLPEQPERRAA